MKKHLFKIAGFLLIFPMFVFAAYTDVSLDSSDTIINTAGINITVSGTTASVDSITVGADSFEVIMSGSAYIQVASSDRRTLTVSGATGSATQSFSCTSAESTLTLSNPASGAQVTLTVTPGSSACTVSGGSSGGGGGSSGGGGGSAPVVPPQTATPATPAVSTQTPATTAKPSSKAKPSLKALIVSPVFNRSLYIGVNNSDVKRLQQLLNNDPDTTVSTSGAGSPGEETNYFGPATERAVRKFQEKHKVAKQGDAGYGVFGPATKAKMQEVSEGEVEISVVPATPSLNINSSRETSAVSLVFNRSLYIGVNNSDVKRLQQLLNNDPDTTVSTSGAGSPGEETNYFGPATERAVRKFQEKHKVAKQGDAGYGVFGPATKAKMQEVSEGAEIIDQEQSAPEKNNNSSSSSSQIQELQKQLKELQNMLKKLGA